MKKDRCIKIKRAVLTAALLCLTLLFAACGGFVSPGDQVSRELDAIKSDETKAEFTNVLVGEEGLPAEYKAKYDDLVEMFREFEYTVKSEEISEDKTEATVVVTITTYDFGSAYRDTYDQVIRDAANEKIDSETDIPRYVLEMMLNNMLGLDEKSYTADVEVHCTKNADGDWITDINDNEGLLDALTGGMRSAIRDVS